VVSPYSRNNKNGKKYEIIFGEIDDLSKLPKLKKLPESKPQEKSRDNQIPCGQRNKGLFIIIKNHAVNVNSYEKLLGFSYDINQKQTETPLLENELKSIVDSVWRYKAENRLLVSGSSIFTISEADFFALSNKQKALVLLVLLKKYHNLRSEPFTIIQEKVGLKLNWDRRAIAKAIAELIEAKKLKQVYVGKGKGDGHKYILL
jgi:hypothetical protein